MSRCSGHRRGAELHGHGPGWIASRRDSTPVPQYLALPYLASWWVPVPRGLLEMMPATKPRIWPGRDNGRQIVGRCSSCRRCTLCEAMRCAALRNADAVAHVVASIVPSSSNCRPSTLLFCGARIRRRRRPRSPRRLARMGRPAIIIASHRSSSVHRICCSTSPACPCPVPPPRRVSGPSVQRSTSDGE